MRYEEGGLSLWYGTPDAPAPEGLVHGEGSGQVSVTAGMRPPSASNAVEVVYRVNGGAPSTVLAALAAHDALQQAQYFEAKLAALYGGDTGEYRGVGRAPGHQIPAEAGQYPTLFQVTGTAGSPAGTALPLLMGAPAPGESGATIARRLQLPSMIMARAAAPGSTTPPA